MPTRRTPHRQPPKKPPFRFTKTQQDEFLQHLRAGMRRGAAAAAVYGDDDPMTRKRIRDFIDAHRSFELLVLDAEREATENVEEALYQAAISGNVAAATKWLEMHGRGFEEHRGRPRSPEPEPVEGAFDDLGAGGVVDLETRRKKS